MHDGKLWVFGGVTSEGQDTCNHMWTYDFYARQWSLVDQKGMVPAARARAYTAVHDGKMLMYGYLDAPEDEVRPKDPQTGSVHATLQKGLCTRPTKLKLLQVDSAAVLCIRCCLGQSAKHAHPAPRLLFVMYWTSSASSD